MTHFIDANASYINQRGRFWQGLKKKMEEIFNKSAVKIK